MTSMFDSASGLSDENKCAIHTTFSSNGNWPYDLSWSTCSELGIPCFLEGTPVLTDQGEIPIEQLTSKNTIDDQKVVKVTKTMNKDNYMILIKKDALSQNVPSQDTYISKNHGIYIDDKLVYAKNLLLLKNLSITIMEIGHTYIYNVLLPTHSKMSVNNMTVETLDPSNPVV